MVKWKRKSIDGAVNFCDPRRVSQLEALEPRTLLSGFTLHTLAVLGDANLEAPRGRIVADSNGDIFFLALENNSSTDEVVGELVKGASTPTVVATFPSAQSDEVGGLAIDSEGDLFGTSGNTVFEIAKGSNTITTLATLTNATTGSDPPANQQSAVVDSQGNIFGVCQLGGADGGGTVWELPAGSGTANVLASFPQSVSNNSVSGITLAANGNLYGTIGQDEGVSGAFGSVWELPTGGSSINILASFDGANGGNPLCPLVIDANGDVFGETQLGGSDIGGTSVLGTGTLFEIPDNSNSITSLFNFSGASGQGPRSGLTADSNGDLFGSTNEGGNMTGSNGASGGGVVFELPKGAAAPVTIEEFNNSSTGSGSTINLLLDSTGDIFGMTGGGAGFQGGTVFEMTPGSSGGGGGGGSSPLSGKLSGSLAASVIAGQKVNIAQNLTITDTGSSAVSGSVNAKLFLSTGTTVDSSSIQLASATKTVKLKAHAHLAEKFKVASLPASVPNGTYHLVAQITDPSGNVSDAASSGTTTVAPPEVSLALSLRKFATTAKAGKKFTETLSIANSGNIPASGTVPIEVFTSPDGLPSDATELTSITKKLNIKNGRAESVPLNLIAPASGSDFLIFVVDPNNTLKETTPANDMIVSASKVTFA